MVRKYWFWVIAIIVVMLDQLTKAIVVTKIPFNTSVEVLGSVLSFTSVHNTGAGFGILQGQNSLFILVALVAIIVIVCTLRKTLEDHHTTIFVALILGGAIGNLIDRILYGFVVDFIDFHIWPAFNVADSALCIGVIGLIWLSLIEKKK